jgi:DNA-binding GntR family transcriptional regulator
LERYFDSGNPTLLERSGIPQLADLIWDIANAPEINEEVGRRFWDIDTRFHRAIVALGRNPRLSESWDLLHVNIVIRRAGLRARMTRERFTISAREHLTIVEAMQTGAAECARDLLSKHLLRVCDQTIRFMMSPDERDLSLPRRHEFGTQTAINARAEDLE